MREVSVDISIKSLYAAVYSFPHPATMAGMMEMSNAYLPINQNWPLFYAKAESAITEKSERACRYPGEVSESLFPDGGIVVIVVVFP